MLKITLACFYCIIVPVIAPASFQMPTEYPGYYGTGINKSSQFQSTTTNFNGLAVWWSMAAFLRSSLIHHSDFQSFPTTVVDPIEASLLEYPAALPLIIAFSICLLFSAIALLVTCVMLKSEYSKTKINVNKLHDLASGMHYSVEHRAEAAVYLAVCSVLCLVIISAGLAANHLANNGINEFQQSVMETISASVSTAVAIRQAIANGASGAPDQSALSAQFSSDSTTIWQSLAPFTILNASIADQIASVDEALQKFETAYLSIETAQRNIVSDLQALTTLLNETIPQTVSAKRAVQIDSNGTTVQVRLSRSLSGLLVRNPIILQPQLTEYWRPYYDPSLRETIFRDAPRSLTSVTDQLHANLHSIVSGPNGAVQTAFKKYVDALNTTITAQYPLIVNNMQKFTDDFSQRFDSFNRRNSQRSLGSTMVLILAVLTVLFSVGSVTAGNTKSTATKLNVCTSLLMAFSWLLCGLTLVYAFYTGNLCKAISSETRLAPWLDKLLAQSSLKPAFPLSSQVAATYLTRRMCLMGHPEPLINLTYHYLAAWSSEADAQKIAFTKSNVDYYAAGSILFSQLYNVTLDTRINSNSPLLSLVKSWSARLRSSPLAAIPVFSTNLTLINYGYLIMTGTNPVFFAGHNSSSVVAQLAADVQQFSDSIARDNLQTDEPVDAQTLSFILADYRTVHLPSIVDTMQQQVDALLQRIRNNQMALVEATKAARSAVQPVRTAVASFQHCYSFATTDSSVAPLAVETQNVIGKALYGPIYGMAKYLSDKITAQVECKQLAQKAYHVEESLCQQTMAGFDSLYWAFGALAVLLGFKIISLRMCLNRFSDNDRLLLIASILKSNYEGNNNSILQQQDLQQNSEQVPDKNSNNNMTDAYLPPGALDVEFSTSNDPTSQLMSSMSVSRQRIGSK